MAGLEQSFVTSDLQWMQVASAFYKWERCSAELRELAFDTSTSWPINYRCNGVSIRLH
jgi:hypothetical protein